MVTVDTIVLLATAAMAAAALVPFARRRPELILVPVTLWLPSGLIYPPLRIHFLDSFVTVFQVTLLYIAAVTVFGSRHALREGLSHPVFKFGALVSCAGAVSAVGSADPLAALFAGLSMGATLIALSIVFAEPLRVRQRDIHLTLLYFGAAAAAIALYQALRDPTFLGNFYSGVVRGFIAGGAGFRPVATIGNPLVASAVFAGLYALALTSPHLKRFTRLALCSLFAGAVLVSISRSSVATVVAVTLLFVAIGGGNGAMRTSKRRVAVALSLAATAVFVTGPLLERFGARLGSRGFFQDGVRGYNAEQALSLWREQWLTGLGAGGYRRIAAGQGPLGFAATVDNQFLTLLVELGAVGIILLIVGLASFRRRPSSDGERNLVPLFAMLFGGLAFEFLNHDTTMLLAAIFALDALTGRPTAVRSGDQALGRVGPRSHAARAPFALPQDRVLLPTTRPPRRHRHPATNHRRYTTTPTVTTPSGENRLFGSEGGEGVAGAAPVGRVAWG